MNKKFTASRLFPLLFLFTGFTMFAQDVPTPPKMSPEMTEFWTPEVPVVTPGKSTPNAAMTAPSDAEVLFNGTDLSKWESADGQPAQWTVHDGVLTVNKGTGDIRTKDEFKDFQLHIEWKIPEDISGKSQFRGNSGVYLQGKYEVQVLDSYNNRTYANGQAGSIYKQSRPLKNAMRPPGEWNVYDIIFTAARFNDDKSLFSPAYVTVLHNGIVVQNHFEIKGGTEYIGLPEYKFLEKGPIILQDHGDPSKPISYRNIWIRKL